MTTSSNQDSVFSTYFCRIIFSFIWALVGLALGYMTIQLCYGNSQNLTVIIITLVVFVTMTITMGIHNWFSPSSNNEVIVVAVEAYSE